MTVDADAGENQVACEILQKKKVTVHDLSDTGLAHFQTSNGSTIQYDGNAWPLFSPY